MSDAPNSDGQSDGRAGWTSATPAPTPLDVEAEGADGNGQESPDTRDGTLISFGMPLEDRLAKRVTIQVFVLAVSIAAFSVIHFITNLMMGRFETSWENPTGGVVYRADILWADVASLIIELSIPIAGYLGALYHNHQLTCCFCSCNLFLVFATSWTLLTLAFRQRELAGNCNLEPDDQNRALCYMWLDNGAHKWVFIGDAICVATLSCCAAMASIRLFHKLSREPANIESTPVVGEVVQLQVADSLVCDTPCVVRLNQPAGNPPWLQEVRTGAAPAVADTRLAPTPPGLTQYFHSTFTRRTCTRNGEWKSLHLWRRQQGQTKATPEAVPWGRELKRASAAAEEDTVPGASMAADGDKRLWW